jgi:hypothetical protein
MAGLLVSKVDNLVDEIVHQVVFLVEIGDHAAR